jgi:hypothetical protein
MSRDRATCPLELASFLQGQVAEAVSPSLEAKPTAVKHHSQIMRHAEDIAGWRTVIAGILFERPKQSSG